MKKILTLALVVVAYAGHIKAITFVNESPTKVPADTPYAAFTNRGLPNGFFVYVDGNWSSVKPGGTTHIGPSKGFTHFELYGAAFSEKLQKPASISWVWDYAGFLLKLQANPSQALAFEAGKTYGEKTAKPGVTKLPKALADRIEKVYGRYKAKPVNAADEAKKIIFKKAPYQNFPKDIEKVVIIWPDRYLLISGTYSLPVHNTGNVPTPAKS